MWAHIEDSLLTRGPTLAAIVVGTLSGAFMGQIARNEAPGAAPRWPCCGCGATAYRALAEAPLAGRALAEAPLASRVLASRALAEAPLGPSTCTDACMYPSDGSCAQQ